MPSESHNIFDGGGSCLHADSNRLIIVVAVKTGVAMKFAMSIASSFHKRFPCSIHCLYVVLSTVFMASAMEMQSQEITFFVHP